MNVTAREVHETLTKIVATIGPASRELPMLRQLVQTGVNVFRINAAHGTLEERDRMVRDIRQISAETQRPVAILVDLAGPKIRLGQLACDPLECAEGAELRLVRGEVTEKDDCLVIRHEPLIDELAIGDRLMLADGTVSLKVESKQADEVRCRVTSGGVVRSGQGVNLPGVDLGVAAMTEDDRRNAIWAAKRGVDFLGLSFVRRPEEIEQLKRLLIEHDSSALVVAKIEKGEALEQLDEIVRVADAVMVARGDLGVETDVAEVAVVQKRVIACCRRHYRPVIVATQMLDSMQHSRRPTRAEVSDVSNAILDGADACMLSGETAIGAYPAEAVDMMRRIMTSTEGMLRGATPRNLEAPSRDVHAITGAVVDGAAQIARQVEASLIVIATRSGATARMRANQRDPICTLGISDSEPTLRRMCLLWGITPISGAPAMDGPALREFIAQRKGIHGGLKSGDRVVYVTGSTVSNSAHNRIDVHEVP